MNKVKRILLAAMMVLGLGVATVGVMQPVAYAGCNGFQCIRDGADAATTQGTTSPESLPALIRRIVNILLFVGGSVAVIMIVIGGIRYIISGGDQSSITSAKNTILYAVIGLVVAALSFAIVNFIVDNLL